MAGRLEAGSLGSCEAALPGSGRAFALATRKSRKQARQQLKTYRRQAQIALWEWLTCELRHNERLDKAALLRWRSHWLASEAGRRSRDALAARVADYRHAAKRELHQAARRAGGVPGTIEDMLARMARRDSEASWEDGVLDRMLAAWAKAVVKSRGAIAVRGAGKAAQSDMT